jgi:hypothetical protein
MISVYEFVIACTSIYRGWVSEVIMPSGNGTYIYGSLPQSLRLDLVQFYHLQFCNNPCCDIPACSVGNEGSIFAHGGSVDVLSSELSPAC